MNNYNLKQTSDTMTGGVRIIGTLMILQLLNPGVPCQQPDVSQLVRPTIQLEESSKTFGQYTNTFTGEYEDTSLNFEENVASFYAHILAIQKPLGKDFEEVLYDNLWDLLVHT